MFRRKAVANLQENDSLLQQEKINELKALIGPLSGRSLQFCNNETLRRYLEARNWNVDKARKMLEETIKWRSTYKPEEILWQEIAVEGETGKVYRADFHDKFGRTVLVLRPGLQNTSSHECQLRHLVYLMENALFNLPEGQEQMIWLIDFTGWSLTKSPVIKTSRETANILQNHYPERLAFGILYNPPKVFETFWKVVRYFLDPKTYQKVKFIYPKNAESSELMQQLFDVETLPTIFGGKDSSKYDHQAYSKMMVIDDVKTARFWDFGDKLAASGNDEFIAEITKEIKCAPPAS